LAIESLETIIRNFNRSGAGIKTGTKQIAFSVVRFTGLGFEDVVVVEVGSKLVNLESGHRIVHIVNFDDGGSAWGKKFWNDVEFASEQVGEFELSREVVLRFGSRVGGDERKGGEFL